MFGIEEWKEVFRSKESQSRGSLRGVAVGLCLALALLLPVSLRSEEACAQFTAKLVANGKSPTTFSTPAELAVPARAIPPGAVLQVRGSHVQFNVDLNTFTVRNYTLKNGNGSPPPQSEIFLSEFPAKGNGKLRGDLRLHLRQTAPYLILERGTGGKSKKIEAYDCSTGGVFLSLGNPLRYTLGTGSPEYASIRQKQSLMSVD